MLFHLAGRRSTVRARATKQQLRHSVPLLHVAPVAATMAVAAAFITVTVLVARTVPGRAGWATARPVAPSPVAPRVVPSLAATVFVTATIDQA